VQWLNYDVVGPICETADFLGQDIPLQMPSDYLAVMDVGAYCSSMSSNYNMRPRPTEVKLNTQLFECPKLERLQNSSLCVRTLQILVDGLSFKYIRHRDTFEDLTFKMES